MLLPIPEAGNDPDCSTGQLEATLLLQYELGDVRNEKWKSTLGNIRRRGRIRVAIRSQQTARHPRWVRRRVHR